MSARPAARPPGTSSPSYRPDIDGLRGVAVLAVVGYHAFPEWLPGGFIGVDVFFVISGFLITGLVLAELRHGRFSLPTFYARRVRRIFPALAVVLLACLVAAWWMLGPGDFRSLGSTAAGGAAFAANLVLWRQVGYFDPAADLKPLLHLWSLGIEEQFYLVWPLLLMLSWRSRWRWWLLGAGIVASFLLNVRLIAPMPAAVFYLPVTRAWELLVGAVLAFAGAGAAASPRGQMATWAAWLGLGLLGSSLVLIDDASVFPGWWALLPTVGTALVIFGAESWINRHVLAHPAIVFVGLISYPLYLWHYPLFSMARHLGADMASTGPRLLLVVTAAVLAWLTYILVERPIRFGPRRRATVPLLSGLIALLAVAGLAASRGVWPARAARPDVAPILAAIGDWNPSSEFRPIPARQHILALGPDATPHVLFFGDSNIEQYGPRLEHLLDSDPQDFLSAYLATVGGCVPVPGVVERSHPTCPRFVADLLDFAQDPRVARVVIGACWRCYFTPDPDSRWFRYAYETTGREVRLSGDPAADAGVLEALRTMLHGLASRKPTYLLLDIPTGPAADPNSMLSRDVLGGFIRRPAQPLSRAAFMANEGPVREALAAAAREAGAQVIDPFATLCPGEICPTVADDGRPLYKDSAHLRPLAASERATFIDQTLRIK